MKIICEHTNKIFEVDLGMRSVIVCPFCSCPIEFSHGTIGLTFDIGVEIESSPFHKIIR